MKRKLLFTIVALLCSVGIQKINAAYTDYLTSGNGWTQVTSASGIVTDGSCTYVIVAKDFDLVVGIPSEGSDGQLTYQTLSGQPARKQAWLIEADSYGSGGYALKNFARTGYYLTAVGGDTGAWNLVARASDKNTANTCYQFTFDGSGNLLIQTNSDVNSDNADRYWGDWTVGNHSNGNTLAGNKTDANKVTFQLFKKNDVSALVYNNGFEGTYTQKYTINTNRYVFQPDGWDVDYTNVSTWNMTVVSSADNMASNFTGTYAVTAGNNKYMVRFRDNQTSEYVDLSQSITFPYAGLYLLSADLIREDASKVTVKLYAGSQEVLNSKNGAWETRSLLLNVTAGQTVKIGIKYENKGADGIKAGADNIKLQKLGNAPVDVTALIANPNFDSNIDSWNAPIGNPKHANNKDGMTNFFESWNSTPKEGRMYQVLEGLPQGTYKLTMKAFTAQAGTMTPANTSVAIYAQGQEVGTTNSSHIHPNYVNSEDVQTYSTWAYVNATGKLEIGMRQYTPAEFRWLGMDDVTLQYLGTSDQEDALLLAELKSKWTAVTSACDLLSDDDYTNVKGAERANLTSALSASVSDIGDYATNAATLQTAYLAFKAGKTNWDLLATEIAKADALGASTTAAVAIGNNNEKTATDALQAVKDLKVTEFNYVDSDYSYAVDLGSWNTTGPTGSLTSQHWSGESREYLEQSSAAYGQDSWDIVYDQNLTLPAGNYVFKVAGRQANSDKITLSLTVKNGETVLGTVADFPKGDTGLGINKSGATSFDSEDAAGFANSNNGRGWEWRYVKFTLADDATVNVSVEAHATAKSMWVSFCDATVQTDNEANIDLIEYNIAVAAANTNYYNNASYSNVTGSEKTTLKSCVDADPGTTTESIATAKSALEGAIAAFSAAKDNYDALTSVNANITETGTLSYADSEKKPSTYTVTSSTTSSDAATQVASLTTALRAYYESHALAEGVDGATDYTSSIAEATCEATATIGEHETYNNGTWTCSNVRIQTGAGYTDASDVTQDYYFDSNGQFWNHNATNARISQTVNGLPCGKYLLTVTSRASSGVTLTLTANGKSVNPVAGMTPGIFGNGWDDTSVEFTVGKAGTAEISFNGNNGGAGEKFFSVDRFRLVRIGNLDAVTLDEDETASIVAKTADVTLTRNIAADTWSTFVVPFDIDNTTLKAQFGDDVRVSEFSASDKTGVTFTPMAEPAITANKPVLVRVSEAKSSFTFNGVEIKVATPTFSQAGVNFVGNYGGDIEVPNELATYIVKSNTLKRSTGEQRLKGFRAYFTVNADSSVKAFFENGINLDDEETGITNLNVNDNLNKNEAIYNLAGQRVQKAQKGLYIVNGRKVVVK